MKKSILACLIALGSYGSIFSQQQKSGVVLEVTKAELFSSKDIKPLVLSANQGKTFAPWDVVVSFKLTVTVTENTAQGVKTTSFFEPCDGGTLTAKQRDIIEKYGKQGVVFTLEGINIMDIGEPGAPYNPAQEKYFSVSNISFTVTQ